MTAAGILAAIALALWLAAGAAPQRCWPSVLPECAGRAR